MTRVLVIAGAVNASLAAAVMDVLGTHGMDVVLAAEEAAVTQPEPELGHEEVLRRYVKQERPDADLRAMVRLERTPREHPTTLRELRSQERGRRGRR